MIYRHNSLTSVAVPTVCCALVSFVMYVNAAKDFHSVRLFYVANSPALGGGFPSRVVNFAHFGGVVTPFFVFFCLVGRIG